MNEELFQRQPIQDQQLDDQGDILNKIDKLESIENQSLNFQNHMKYLANEYIWAAQMSNDQKYLAIGKRYRKIYLYYLKNKKIITIIKLNVKYQAIYLIKFSYDSRYLLFGDSEGFLCCYDINANCKIIYNQMVHSQPICDILSIDDDQILTCSKDQSLIITNIKNNQQLLKIENAHTSCITGIDFDKSNDYIVSCSLDYIIKFFNRKNGMLQIQQQSSQKVEGNGIQDIQLIQNNNKLISSDYEQLILWLIDYQRLQLIQFKELNYMNYNFTSVLNTNNIIVISEETILILDNSLNVQQSIKINMGSILSYFKARQLNSLDYIIIPGNRGYHKLLILKKVKKISSY